MSLRNLTKIWLQMIETNTAFQPIKFKELQKNKNPKEPKKINTKHPQRWRA